jgi:2'-5' RNA ligase
LEEIRQLRLFIAILTPEKVKIALERAQRRFQNVLPSKAARWTPREQFHMTLKFLGNVPSTQLETLLQASAAACSPFAPLHLTVAGIGFFTAGRAPRVLWAGVTDSDNQLATLWSALQSATSFIIREPSEANFTAHVTLARFNKLQRTEGSEVASLARRFDHVVFGEWTTPEIHLMRSELSPSGARHSLLSPLALGPTGKSKGAAL